MPGPRRSDVTLFAVDDSSVQIVWRGLPAGDLVAEVRDVDGRRVALATVALAEPAAPGGVVLDDLPASSPLTVVVTPPVPASVVRLPFRTADRLPGQELSRVATISDLHLGTRVFGHRGTISEAPHPEGEHPLRCTRAAIADLTAWGAQRVLVKGDVTNGASFDQWRAYAGLVGESELPFDALPGNHDTEHPQATDAFPARDAARVFRFKMADPILVRDLPGLRMILLDTCVPGSNRGALAPVLADTLDAARDTDPDATVLIALHHQLHPRSGQEGWPVGIRHRDSLDLLERLARVHPRALVTSGHTHRHRRWSHAGVTTTQVGSVKDYPGVWAGYVVAEGGMRQLVRRVTEPSAIAWTDHCRRAAFGAWRFIGPGPMTSRTFDLIWQ